MKKYKVKINLECTISEEELWNNGFLSGRQSEQYYVDYILRTRLGEVLGYTNVFDALEVEEVQ